MQPLSFVAAQFHVRQRRNRGAVTRHKAAGAAERVKARAAQNRLAVDRSLHQGLRVLDAEAPATSQASCSNSDELVRLLVQNQTLDLPEQGVCLPDEQPETGRWIHPGFARDFAEFDYLGRGESSAFAIVA